MSKSYPLWSEKGFFLGLVCLGIFAGIAIQSYVSGAGLLLSWFCGIPLAVLLMTEGVGRFLQSILAR